MANNVVKKSVRAFCLWAGVRPTELASAAGITRQALNYHAGRDSSFVEYDKKTKRFEVKGGDGVTAAAGKIKAVKIPKKSKNEMPFDEFAAYVGVNKSEFMEAAGLHKQYYSRLADSNYDMIVRYCHDTGAFQIIQPEEVRGSGKIKFNRG